MASTSPIHQLQHAAVDLVKAVVVHPVGTTRTVVGRAHGTLVVGRAVTAQVVKGAAGLVASRLPAAGGRAGATTSVPPRSTVPVVKPTPEPTAGTAPVGTAPVEEWPDPVTSIDEGAEPAHVEATPADVARAAARKVPAKKAPAKKAPAKKTPVQKAPAKKAPVAKKAPAVTKSTPSGQLPPRKRPAAGAADPGKA